MGDMFGSVARAFEQGGWGMYPISVALIFALTIIFDRIWVLYFRVNIDKETFLRGLKKHIYAGDLDKAISYCAGQKRTPLVSVIKAGLVNVPKSDEDVQAAMDEATLRESPRLERRTGYLAMIGNVATLRWGCTERSWGSSARSPQWPTPIRPTRPRCCRVPTSVCDMGSPLRQMPQFAQDHVAGPAARGFMSGPIVTVRGGYPDNVWHGDLNDEIATPDEARAAVADLAGRGADVIKIALEPGSEEDPWPMLDLQQVQAIVQEAHARGKLVRAHVGRTNGTDVLDIVLKSGVDVIDHVPLPVVSAREIYGLIKDSGPANFSTDMSWPEAKAIFTQGKAAFYTEANSLYKNATDPAKSKVADKVGFAPFPAGPAGSKPYNIPSRRALAQGTGSRRGGAGARRARRAGRPGERDGSRGPRPRASPGHVDVPGRGEAGRRPRRARRPVVHARGVGAARRGRAEPGRRGGPSAGGAARVRARERGRTAHARAGCRSPRRGRPAPRVDRRRDEEPGVPVPDPADAGVRRRERTASSPRPEAAVPGAARPRPTSWPSAGSNSRSSSGPSRPSRRRSRAVRPARPCGSNSPRSN